ncbi:MAG TPA: thiol peroxidase [Spirochaetota bacterium]|nr:thiol peroxidase [Spirochaetota bacterium]HPI90338.1 thiol peroxidase [Spirochaetota bacterium]HPR49427.1 thiol peroxidase [Spirochaetota bacterium]
MSTITLKGKTIHTSGNLPVVGTRAPSFSLTGRDLQDHSLAEFSGQRIILNIFPSLDTPVCATSVRTFNARASSLSNAVVLAVSRDLPFAHNRFCTTEGIEHVFALSEMRNRDFGRDYGVEIVDGPMAGLLARAVVVLDENGTVIHAELVSEIAQEPDYDKALAAL